MKAYAVSLLTTSVRLTDKYVSGSHSGIGAVAKKAMKQKAALLLHGLFILLFIYLNFGDTVVIPSVSFISAFDIKGYIGSFHGFIKGQAERFHLLPPARRKQCHHPQRWLHCNHIFRRTAGNSGQRMQWKPSGILKSQCCLHPPV